ncbi:hypothetical protein C8R45DRAFT_942891 [Mycena sanguinolenta]|nr:hypothetical protein C8R45DRAFT_942891 [Mycena sanguinolenta]
MLDPSYPCSFQTLTTTYYWHAPSLGPTEDKALKSEALRCVEKSTHIPTKLATWLEFMIQNEPAAVPQITSTSGGPCRAGSCQEGSWGQTHRTPHPCPASGRTKMAKASLPSANTPTIKHGSRLSVRRRSGVGKQNGRQSGRRQMLELRI